MPTHTIFYSWQSDLPNSTNRGFIEDCLEKATKAVRANEELNLDPCLERDTRGVAGSPDIAATIFEKIRRADIFVGDVSFISPSGAGRPTPNPNVLVELGFAAGCLGWERIICVFNEGTGSISDLPFDIRSRRVRAYKLVEGQEKAEPRKSLISVLKSDIADILHAPDKAEAEAMQQLLSSLAPELISVIVFGDELEHRSVKPWIDSLRYQFESTAEAVRRLASSEVAVRNSIAPELEELAATLDEAANLRMHMGSWPEFEGLVKKAVEKAKALKQARIDGLPLSEDSITQVRETLASVQRQLAGLASRAEDMARQGRIEDLQSETSQLGETLLRLGHFPIGVIRSGLAERVIEIGRDLHLIETTQIFIDGGASVRSILERLRNGTDKLTELVDSLKKQE